MRGYLDTGPIRSSALGLCLLILSGCRGPSPSVVAVAYTPPEAIPYIVPSPSPTPRSSVPPSTSTAEVPSSTPTSPSGSLPSLTPTFDASTIVTRTPAAQQSCQLPGPGRPIDYSDDPDIMGDEILGYLNAGGDPQDLETILTSAEFVAKAGLEGSEARVIIRDVTGDRTADTLLEFDNGWKGRLYVFVCLDDHYLRSHTDQYAIIRFAAVEDANGDGTSEIAYYRREMGGSWSFYDCFFVIEWDGQQFVQLIDGDADCGAHKAFSFYTTNYGLRDIDDNGTKELLLEQSPGRPECGGGPTRGWTDIWMWNGSRFVFNYREYDPAGYRFQAAQDGDDAPKAHRYDPALAFYQQVLLDEGLLPIGPSGEAMCEGTILPYADPDERQRLEAYASFRIMLLHAQRGLVEDAKAAHEAMLQKYPTGAAGHAYAELAEAFWDDYQESHDMGLACTAAIQFAQDHAADVLTPLGRETYGWVNRDYAPEDICPFP